MTYILKNLNLSHVLLASRVLDYDITDGNSVAKGIFQRFSLAHTLVKLKVPTLTTATQLGLCVVFRHFFLSQLI